SVWQALALLILCRILFGGFGMGGGGRQSHYRGNMADRMTDRMADRFAERWQNMSPEERERFRQRVRERRGLHPGANASSAQYKRFSTLHMGPRMCFSSGRSTNLRRRRTRFLYESTHHRSMQSSGGALRCHSSLASLAKGFVHPGTCPSAVTWQAVLKQSAQT